MIDCCYGKVVTTGCKAAAKEHGAVMADDGRTLTAKTSDLYLGMQAPLEISKIKAYPGHLPYYSSPRTGRQSSVFESLR